MLDGAMRSIAPIQTKDRSVDLGARNDRNSFSKERNSSFSSNSKDSKFQDNLEKKMNRPDKPEKSSLAAKENLGDKSGPSSVPKSVNDRKEDMSTTRPERNSAVNQSNQRIEKSGMDEKEPGEISPEMSLFAARQANANNPILEFMDSMENEFGVAPDRLVEAFGGLSDSQLMQSPEESMDVYLKQLDIPTEGMEEAEGMYQKLLNSMRFSKVEKSDNTKLIPLELQSALSEMQSLEQPVALDAKSGLAGLNKQFFDVYPERFGRPINEDGFVPGQNTMADKSFMPNAAGEFVENASQSPKANQAMSTEEYLWAKRGASADQASVATADDGDSGLWALGASTGAAAAKVASDVAAGPSKLTDMDGVDIDTPEWMSKLSEASGDTSIESNDLVAKDSQYSDGSESSQEGESEFQQQNNGLAGPANAKNDANKFAKILATGGAAAGEAGAGRDAEGIETMVKNVKLLSQKGGGEMKVQLNQDGLGEVQLKVAVNEGKVDIQMLTANKDAKKLIETDLNLLKTELGEKKIELNEIKVEVAKDIKNQLDQQLADQRREETRQFWNQFKQENDAKRAMSMNMGINSYQAKDPTSLSDRSSAADGYRESNLDGRLNIVA